MNLPKVIPINVDQVLDKVEKLDEKWQDVVSYNYCHTTLPFMGTSISLITRNSTNGNRVCETTFHQYKILEHFHPHPLFVLLSMFTTSNLQCQFSSHPHSYMWKIGHCLNLMFTHVLKKHGEAQWAFSHFLPHMVFKINRQKMEGNAQGHTILVMPTTKCVTWYKTQCVMYIFLRPKGY